MNKTELLTRLSSTAEERVLLSHALDQLQLAQRRSIPTHTGFLSPAEIAAVRRLSREAGGADLFLSGGWEGAERRRCIFLPDWQRPEDVDPADYISAVRATWFPSHTLTHRDFLGALMGLGLKRDAIGDLLVSQGSCDILLLPELQDFVTANLEYAGREKLHLQPVALDSLHFPTPRVKLIHDTVPSLRLDAVAASGFGLSRSKLADFVRSGRVTVNWQSVTRTDFPVAEGALIACRGLGKCRLAQVGALSRKGRINITVERFL